MDVQSGDSYSRWETSMRSTYSPIMICDHGVAGTISFHMDATPSHIKEWHSTEFPVSNCRIASKEEHAAAGWDVTNYPVSISC